MAKKKVHGADDGHQSEEHHHSVDSFLDDLESDSPTPSPEAIASAAVSREPEASASQVERQNKFAVEKDSAGDAFNPEIHATKASGEPSLTPSGKFRRKRGTVSKVGQPKSKAVVPAISDEELKRKARATGHGCAEILFRCCTMLGGSEWQPVKNEAEQIDERRDISEVLSDYCEAHNITDLPPGLMVGIVLSSYVLPRFTLPETQKRASKFGVWVKTKWLNIMHWRAHRASRSNDRNDGKRQNNTGEINSREKKTVGPRNPSI